jgi:anaphase-promoting complex subunit 5
MKGLSTAISAASVAWKARFLPVLFYAFSVIATILIQLEEYTAAYQMLDSIMPQVLECEDAYLTAQCFACLADGQVGLAGMRKGVSRVECLGRALGFIDRAFTGK